VGEGLGRGEEAERGRPSWDGEPAGQSLKGNGFGDPATLSSAPLLDPPPAATPGWEVPLSSISKP
jgi:hypothetical protein